MIGRFFRYLLALALLLALTPAPAGAFSYYPNTFPHGTIQVAMPTLGVAVQPGSERLTFTLHFEGKRLPMNYNATSGVATYQLAKPLSPGTYQGAIEIDSASSAPLMLPVSFKVASGASTLPADINLATWQTLTWLNALRRTEGLPPLTPGPNLAQAASAHASYVANHYDLYGANTSLHTEPDPHASGFLGQTLAQRDAAEAVPSFGYGEVADVGSDTPMSALRALMGTTFHRFGMLSDTAARYGAGFAAPGGANPDVFVADMGQVPSSGIKVKAVPYPYVGQTNVPLSFTGELPNPLAGQRSDAQLASQPAGYPVSLSFEGSQVADITVSSASLSDAAGPVKAILVDAQSYTDQNAVYGGDSMAGSAALFAEQPLSPSTTYSATFTGQVTLASGGTQPFNETWSFTTRPPAQVVTAFVYQSNLYLKGNGLSGADPWIDYVGNAPSSASSVWSSSQMAELSVPDPQDILGVSLGNGQTYTTLSPAPFHDAGKAPWAEQYIFRAWALGLVKGMGGGVFAPDAPVTQQQVLTMLYRAAGAPPQAGQPPADGAAPWAQPAVAWAASQGMLTAGFAPAASAARQTVARWLLQSHGIAPSAQPVTFSDAAQVALPDRGYVSRAASMGIIDGFPGGTFRPASAVTRAQMTKLLVELALPALPSKGH